MGEIGDQRRHERRDAQRNLERVLQAAQELFSERGPEVRIEEVARRAGVGVGTIYRRFPSKEQLFAAVSLAACADTCHCLAQAAEDVSDPLAKLRAIITAHYTRCLSQAPLLDSPGPGAEHPPETEHPGLYPALRTMVEEVIVAGQAQGHIRPGDPTTLAALTLELLSPRAVQRLSHVVGACDQAAEQVADFIVAGLLPEGAA